MLRLQHPSVGVQVIQHIPQRLIRIQRLHGSARKQYWRRWPKANAAHGQVRTRSNADTTCDSVWSADHAG